MRGRLSAIGYPVSHLVSQGDRTAKQEEGRRNSDDYRTELGDVVSRRRFIGVLRSRS